MENTRKPKNKSVRYGKRRGGYLYWCIAVLLFLAALTGYLFYKDRIAGLVCGIVLVIFLAALIGIGLFYRPRVLHDLMDFAEGYNHMQKQLLDEFSIPYGLAEMDGRMLWMNRRLAELTHKGEHYHKNIATLIPEFDVSKFPEDDEVHWMELPYEGKVFRIGMQRVVLDNLQEGSSLADQLQENTGIVGLSFYDITELDQVQKENYENRQVVGLLYVDNYEEAMESVEDIRRSMLEALVERRITKYVASVGGVCKKTEKDKYFLVMNRKGLEQMMADRFSVLEDVKMVNIGNSIHVTISIGIGSSGGGYIQDSEAARSAMEMALARGGDQVALKEGDKIQFFGGKTQHSEKNTRVRARVKAQALWEMMGTRDRVLVMGHKITDIDSFGASVGVCRMAKQAGREVHIVIGDLNSSIRPWVNLLKDSGDYPSDFFIGHAQAMEMAKHNTIVVVVDTNRPSMTECEDILYLSKTVVVLDHHRQTTEKIEHAALSYIEPSASSACEMITELMQYCAEKIHLKPLEADCIYAGIVIDTNNFVAKTGSRTFEAAAYLRKAGADVTRVRKAFRNDMGTYKARAEAVRNAEAYMGVYAISNCPGEGLESPTVVGAQAANELLNIVGVKASFVLTEFGGKVYISARAIDEVNVQIIMERLGGGGHMNIAGAQLSGVTLEEARNRLKEELKQMTEEGAI